MKAKRFYKDVTTTPSGAGHHVLLDGRVLKTPGKLPLVLPSAAIANLIAAEWEAQGEHILPASMPCTRLMNVAVERAPTARDDLVAEIRRFAGTDTLCYRERELAALARLQAERWDPLLRWADEGQGIALKSTDSLLAIEQDKAALDVVTDYARDLDDMHLTLLAHFANVFGSAVLAIATLKGKTTALEAFALSRLSEDWQIDQWGEDEEAKDITDALRAEVEALGALIH